MTICLFPTKIRVGSKKKPSKKCQIFEKIDSSSIRIVAYFFKQKKVEKIKILNGQKSSKNGYRSSLGSKEAQKNHFESFLGNFGPNSDFEKKTFFEKNIETP